MAGKKKMDPVSEAAMEIANAERKKHAVIRERQEEREQKIASAHQLIGRIQGAKMVADFANVSGFAWLKEVHDLKLYRDMPSIETWEKFCNSVGISRHTAENGIKNLEILGEEFLVTVSGFGVSYRDLRKLRQLTSEGQISIDDNTVLIGDEAIPLDADHKDDLQAALERVIQSKDQVINEQSANLKTKERLISDKQKLIESQSRELSRYEGEAERKGLTATEDGFIKQCDASRITIDGFLAKFDPELNPLPEDATPRMRASLMETLGYFKRIIDATYDTAADLYGDPDMDDDWVPPHLRDAAAGEE